MRSPDAPEFVEIPPLPYLASRLEQAQKTLSEVTAVLLGRGDEGQRVKALEDALSRVIQEASGLVNNLQVPNLGTGIYDRDLRIANLIYAIEQTAPLGLHTLHVRQHCPHCQAEGMGYPDHSLNHPCPARGGEWTLMVHGPLPAEASADGE